MALRAPSGRSCHASDFNGKTQLSGFGEAQQFSVSANRRQAIESASTVATHYEGQAICRPDRLFLAPPATPSMKSVPAMVAWIPGKGAAGEIQGHPLHPCLQSQGSHSSPSETPGDRRSNQGIQSSPEESFVHISRDTSPGTGPMSPAADCPFPGLRSARPRPKSPDGRSRSDHSSTISIRRFGIGGGTDCVFPVSGQSTSIASISASRPSPK